MIQCKRDNFLRRSRRCWRLLCNSYYINVFQIFGWGTFCLILVDRFTNMGSFVPMISILCGAVVLCKGIWKKAIIIESLLNWFWTQCKARRCYGTYADQTSEFHSWSSSLCLFNEVTNKTNESLQENQASFYLRQRVGLNSDGSVEGVT